MVSRQPTPRPWNNQPQSIAWLAEASVGRSWNIRRDCQSPAYRPPSALRGILQLMCAETDDRWGHLTGCMYFLPNAAVALFDCHIWWCRPYFQVSSGTKCGEYINQSLWRIEVVGGGRVHGKEMKYHQNIICAVACDWYSIHIINSEKRNYI